jgi:peptidyl-tRNA hydrolase
MKKFTCVIRDNTGALKQDVLQAQNRMDALNQIRKLGGVPVSVTEDDSPKSSFRNQWNMRVAWVGVSGCLAVVMTLIFLEWSRGGFKKQGNDRIRLKEHDVSRGALPHKRPHTIATVKTENHSKEQRALTRKTNTIVYADVEREPDASHEKREIGQVRLPTQSDVGSPPPQPKPHSYKSATEGLLSMALGTKPGEMIPPMPISKNLDDDFANSLTNTIVIYEDDDERTAALKEKVAVAKMELLELVGQGKSVSEVLKEYQDSVNKQAALREEAQRELAELYKTATPEQVEEYLKKINDALDEMGIEPIKLRSVRAAP